MPAEPGVLARPDREAVIPITVERRGLRLPLFSLAMIALFVVAALVAPLLSLPDPTAQSLRARFTPPAEWSGRAPEELWAGGALRATGDSLEVDVPAAGARIVTLRRAGDPQSAAK